MGRSLARPLAQIEEVEWCRTGTRSRPARRRFLHSGFADVGRSSASSPLVRAGRSGHDHSPIAGDNRGSAYPLVTAAYAGPCSHAIDHIQARVDALIETTAAAGRAGRESRGALMHRQPTPASIAAAEQKLGDGTRPERALAAIAQARAADRAGNKRACQRALADARRALGR
jgi:hypothetical protein